MRYLFFDVEGANCYKFVSKMCTFGYVITDEKFKVSEKVDVVMNPESPFDKHILKENMNAYPVDLYLQRPAFGYFYNAIKHILEHEEQIIVGWSIDNDVRYVYDSCRRYNKKQIKYQYFDVQKVVEIVENLENAIKLETACNNYGIDIMVTHKSDDDAYMTMEITKKLCEKLHLTLEEMVAKYPEALSDVDKFASTRMSRKEIEKRNNRRSVYSKMRFASQMKKTKSSYFDENSVIFISIGSIDAHYDSVKSLIAYAANCSAKFTKDIPESTIYIGTKKELESHRKNDMFSNKTLLEIEDILSKVYEESKNNHS